MSNATKNPVALPGGTEMLLGKTQVAAALGVSVRMVEKMVSNGSFPRPDLMLGCRPRWRPATYKGWVDRETGKVG